MVPPKIFISYAEEDEPRKRQILSHLGPIPVDVWHAGLVTAGEDKDERLRREIDASSIALLLVSPDFLASEAIYRRVLSRVRARADAGAMRVVPILLRPCAWTQDEWLRTLEPWPPDERSLADRTGAEIDAALANLARWVAGLVEQPALGLWEAAEKIYLDWIERVASVAERRRFAGFGVDRRRLVSRALKDVYVEPDLLPDEWMRHQRDRERELRAALDRDALDGAQRRELAAEYRKLTGAEHAHGISREPRKPMREVVEDALKKRSSLVILADLGMGKSTLLQWLALDAAERARAQAEEGAKRIPIRVSLADFDPAKTRDLSAFLIAQVRSALDAETGAAAALEVIAARIRRGEVLLLLDGLNERAELRGTIVARIDEYMRARPNARLVLTSRIWAYDFPLCGDAPVWHLAGFTDDQMKLFVGRSAAGGDKAGRALFEVLYKYEILRELVRNPFYMNLAWLLGEAEMAGIAHPVQLYERAFERLWWVSDAGAGDPRWRSLEPGEIERRRRIWAHVAAAQIANGKKAEHHQKLVSRVEAALREMEGGEERDADTLVREALERAGLFEQSLTGGLQWFHPSVQEYLAAVRLTREPVADLSPRAAEVLAISARHEVVVLALARARHVLCEDEMARDALLRLLEPAEPREWIGGRGLLVAEAILAESDEIEPTLGSRLIGRLLRRMKEVPAPRDGDALFLPLYRLERRPALIDEDIFVELLGLALPDHIVPEMVRLSAIKLVAARAEKDERALAACESIWKNEKIADGTRAELAASLVACGHLPDASMLPALQHGTAWSHVARMAMGLMRAGEVANARLAELEAAATDEKDRSTLAALRLLMAPREESAEAAIGYLHGSHSDPCAKALAHAAAQSDTVLWCLLARAKAEKKDSSKLAAAVAAGLPAGALERVLSPWLLGVEQEMGLEWTREAARGAQSRALSKSLVIKVHEEPPARALRAVTLLTALVHPFRAAEELGPALGPAVLRLAEVMEPAHFGEAMAVFRNVQLKAPAMTTFRRIVREGSPEQVRALWGFSQDDWQVLKDRMVDALERGELKTALAWAHVLHWGEVRRDEMIQVLRRILQVGDPETADDAARLLAYEQVCEPEVARALARAMVKGGGKDAHRQSVLRNVIVKGRIADEETLRVLLSTEMEKDAIGRCADLLVKNDPALLDRMIDMLLAAEGTAQDRIADVISSLLIRFDPADSDTCGTRVRRLIERLRGSRQGRRLLVMSFGHHAESGDFREVWRASLREVEADPVLAFTAAEKLVWFGKGAEILQEARSVLRRLLGSNRPWLIVESACRLLFDEAEQDAIEIAVRRCVGQDAAVTAAAGFLLYAMERLDDREADWLLPCLTVEDDSPNELAECRRTALERWQQTCRRAVEAVGSPKGAELVEDPTEDEGIRSLWTHWSHRVCEDAARLLVLLRRRDVVPALIGWLQVEDYHRKMFAWNLLGLMDAWREDGAIQYQLDRLRGNHWYEFQDASDWLWRHAPERLEHVDRLVEYIAKNSWTELRKSTVARLRMGCSARADWARRAMAAAAILKPAMSRVIVIQVVLEAGRIGAEECIAHVEAVTTCHPGEVETIPGLVDLIDATPLLSAAWQERLGTGTPAKRVEAANLFWQRNATPASLRDAVTKALRASLYDEDLSVRLDCVLGLAQLDVFDEDVLAATRSLRDAEFGDGEQRILYGELYSREDWTARSIWSRVRAASELADRQLDAKENGAMLAQIIQRPDIDASPFLVASELLAKVGGYEALRRKILSEHVTSEGGQSLWIRGLVDQAEAAGVGPHVLGPIALKILLQRHFHDDWAIRYLWGDVKDEPVSNPARGWRTRPIGAMRYHSDALERAWAIEQQLQSCRLPRKLILAILMEWAGVEPEEAKRIAEGLLRDLAGIAERLLPWVARRAGDGPEQELARSHLWRLIEEGGVGRAAVASDPAVRGGAM